MPIQIPADEPRQFPLAFRADGSDADAVPPATLTAQIANGRVTVEYSPDSQVLTVTPVPGTAGPETISFAELEGSLELMVAAKATKVVFGDPQAVAAA